MSKEMQKDNTRHVLLGRVTSPFGIKGWVKVYSYTQPMENVLQYRQWRLTRDGRSLDVEIVQGRKQGKGLVAQIKGVTTPEDARNYCGYEILLPAEALPSLDDGEFYWHQLEGLQVFTQDADGNDLLLGKVSHLIETGSNDVLVVQATRASIDQRERLLPYLPEQVIQEINLDEGFMRVLWDPEF